MRQADPDLDVDSIKRILMETARDEGPAGEDNTYGWGFVDAYAAVQKVLNDYGTVEGQVRNGSWQDEPLPEAEVSLAGSQIRFRIDDQGYYRGSAPNGTYTLRAFLDGFAPDSAVVSLQGGHPVRQDFVLSDNAGPLITRVDPQEATHDTLGPYPITASVTDVSTVAGVRLHYRFDEGGWAEVPMTAAGRPRDPVGDSGASAGVDYEAVIPGAPAGTEIAYYISAMDGPGTGSAAPPGAPAQVYQLEVRRLVYFTGFEDPPDPDWQVGAPGDEAVSGIWTREAPIGTSEDGRTIQTGRDHTPDPGEKCYLTGNGVPGGGIGDADVDGGCTSLLSPVFDLSHDRHAFVSYARWFGEGGAAQDDTFRVDVSSDGGASWQALERVGTPDTVWVESTLRVDDHIALTPQVRFRFRACDLGLAGVVEAALDDFLVEGFTPALDDSNETPPPARRLYNLPNPFLLAQAGGAAATTIHMILRGRSPVHVEIFDAAGRRIRRLYDGPMDPDAASVAWDGKDDRGHAVRSGVYFCRVETNEFQETLPLTAISSAHGSR
jgi:hypothetical protein